MSPVRRVLVAVALISLLATGLAAQGQSKGGSTMVFKVRLIQEATYRTPHPPDGNAGDVFSTTLRLFAVGPLFGHADKAFVGTMSFSYTFQGACSSAAAGCKGTTNLNTLTKLPGGTITANGKNISLGRLPYVVPILSGTGSFAGAQGTISIAPAGAAEDIYNIKLP
jgi:hypothetical protein